MFWVGIMGSLGAGVATGSENTNNALAILLAQHVLSQSSQTPNAACLAVGAIAKQFNQETRVVRTSIAPTSAALFFAQQRAALVQKIQGKHSGYHSVKRPLSTPGHHFNLNGKVQFPDPDPSGLGALQSTIIKNNSRPDNFIVCRHYTLWYLHAMPQGKLPFLRNPELNFEKQWQACKTSIQNSVSKLTEGMYRLLLTQTPECHLLHNHQLGTWLTNQYHDLQAEFAVLQPRPQHAHKISRTFLLESDNHAMALVLEHKVKWGQPYFALKFYDPNATTNHWRMVRFQPENFQALSLKNLMPTKTYQCYYRFGDEHTLVYAMPSNPQAFFEQGRTKNALTNWPNTLPRQLASTLGVNDFSKVSFMQLSHLLYDRLATYGLYRHVFALATQLKNQGQFNWDTPYKDLDWRSINEVSTQQWLSLELAELAAAKNEAAVKNFEQSFATAMQVLPENMQEAALVQVLMQVYNFENTGSSLWNIALAEPSWSTSAACAWGMSLLNLAQHSSKTLQNYYLDTLPKILAGQDSVFASALAVPLLLGNQEKIAAYGQVLQEWLLMLHVSPANAAQRLTAVQSLHTLLFPTHEGQCLLSQAANKQQKAALKTWMECLFAITDDARDLLLSDLAENGPADPAHIKLPEAFANLDQGLNLLLEGLQRESVKGNMYAIESCLWLTTLAQNTLSKSPNFTIILPNFFCSLSPHQLPPTGSQHL